MTVQVWYQEIIFIDYLFEDFGLVTLRGDEKILFNLLCYVMSERSLMLIISLPLLNLVDNSIKFIVMEI